MSDPELPWKLLPKEDGVYLHLSQYEENPLLPAYRGPVETLINLGPKEQVMEAFSQFLAHEDYGERMAP